MNYIKHLLLCGALGVVSFSLSARGRGDCEDINQGREVFTQACEQLKAKPDLSSNDYAIINQASKKVSASMGRAFSEEELIAAVDTVLDALGNKLSPEMHSAMNTSKGALIARLRKFNVTGVAFAVDPNGAFFWDTQDPAFDVVFKNSAGEIKTKRFQADIESIGLKIEFAINLNLIFFVGTDLNYFDATDKIDLGVGVEVGAVCGTGLTVTYAPLKTMSGGMLMVTLALIGFPGVSLSVVTGGSLTPIA